MRGEYNHAAFLCSVNQSLEHPFGVAAIERSRHFVKKQDGGGWLQEAPRNHHELSCCKRQVLDPVIKFWRVQRQLAEYCRSRLSTGHDFGFRA